MHFFYRFRKLNFWLLLIIGLVSTATAFAAGGGGGGGGSETPPPPSCTVDTWTCSDWGVCSSEGKQTRICSLSFNCPTAQTPQPQETQNCTPPAATPKPEPSPKTGTQSGESSEPVKNQPAASTINFESSPSEKSIKKCTESEVTCSSWGQCQENGHQTRTCKVTNVCAGAPKPKLEQDQVCVGLKCGQLETIKDRISCRLKLTSGEMKKEFSILYFPEYCKAEGEWTDKKACIALYQSFGTCWQMPFGEGRQQCARDVIEIGNLIEEKNKCFSLGNAMAQYNCANELKEKVEHLILFNLYELEVEAEALLTKGKVSLENVVDFEVFIESKKIELEKAERIKDWKRIIEEAKNQWIVFNGKLL